MSEQIAVALLVGCVSLIDFIMGKQKKIRIEIDKVSVGKEAHEQDYCPIGENQICRLENIACRYGLTEVEPPYECPINRGLKLTFKLIE